ncbi:hypothetical protein ACMAZF_09115 [Psychrobium sp. nBUS_13]|uniref:hypothetical protein n=1 Tax=Psychrobium sp. nBUS_13 TaxID=3395319 RepID=UPI003EBADD9F
MNAWKELHWIQKSLIGCLVLMMVALMPELIPLLDLGGIELIFGFVVLNIKTAKYWVYTKYRQLRNLAASVLVAFIGSALAKPKTFMFHGGVCCGVLLFTGSIVLSSGFLLPVMIANSYLI